MAIPYALEVEYRICHPCHVTAVLHLRLVQSDTLCATAFLQTLAKIDSHRRRGKQVMEAQKWLEEMPCKDVS